MAKPLAMHWRFGRRIQTRFGNFCPKRKRSRLLFNLNSLIQLRSAQAWNYWTRYLIAILKGNTLLTWFLSFTYFTLNYLKDSEIVGIALKVLNRAVVHKGAQMIATSVQFSTKERVQNMHARPRWWTFAIEFLKPEVASLIAARYQPVLKIFIWRENEAGRYSILVRRNCCLSPSLKLWDKVYDGNIERKHFTYVIPRICVFHI